MTNKEFRLDEKIEELKKALTLEFIHYYPERVFELIQNLDKDIKQAIKLLKEELSKSQKVLVPIIRIEYPCFNWNIIARIDKIMGDLAK